MVCLQMRLVELGNRIEEAGTAEEEKNGRVGIPRYFYCFLIVFNLHYFSLAPSFAPSFAPSIGYVSLSNNSGVPDLSSLIRLQSFSMTQPLYQAKGHSYLCYITGQWSSDEVE